MVELPREFRTTPFSYYIWSRSPRAAHVAAFALGRFADPEFRWMSIRESTTRPAPEEAWVSRHLPEDRILLPLSEVEMGRDPKVPKATFDAMVRPEGAATDWVALDHFLLLPPRLQAILEEEHYGSSPRAVVIANTNWVRQFYPTDPDLLRAYTDVFPQAGFSMVTTSVPPPYKGRYGFNIVLRLDVLSASEWRNAELVVEKGLRTGEFATGASYRSAELPWYLELGEEVERSSA